MTLTILDPRTGHLITITVPDGSGLQARLRRGGQP